LRSTRWTRRFSTSTAPWSFAAAQADGWLYPRWVPGINGGLGGPLFTFYSPLIYFLMTVFHAPGVPFALTWRLVVALAFVAASAGTFGLGLALFRRADVALAGAALYAYSPYLLRELFERGSPQGVAIAFYPWVLWGCWRWRSAPRASVWPWHPGPGRPSSSPTTQARSWLCRSWSSGGASSACATAAGGPC
jgi:uncharacterized membrane protein